MSTSSLNQLIHAVAGDHIAAYMLVLARISPLFIIAPVFSSKLLIPRVRAILAVGITVGITPLAAHGHHIPTNPFALLELMVQGFLVGFAVAFAMACVFGAVQGAGMLADSLSGFSYGASVDPINGNQGGSLSNLYTMVGTAMFLAIGGDAWMLRAITTTFRVIPIDKGPQINGLASGAETLFSTVLVGAVELAAPVILALTVTDIAFGLVSKVVPQLNVFAVGFPVKVGVALLVVGVSLPFLGTWMTGQLQSSVGTALHSLQAVA